MENITWIKDVVFILPVAGLIWKAATLSAKVKQNEGDIINLKSVVGSQNTEILNSLKQLNDSIMALRCEVEIIKALRKKELEVENAAQKTE